MLIDVQSAYSPILDPTSYPGRIVVQTDHKLYSYIKETIPVWKEDDRYKEYDITPPFEDLCRDYMVQMVAYEEDRPEHFPPAPLTEIDIHLAVDTAPSHNILDYYCRLTVFSAEAVVRSEVIVHLGAAALG